MTLGFLSGSKNFCKHHCVSCEVFLFYTHTTGSIEWQSPTPRLQIGDCSEIQNFHWELCDLLLSSHQKFLQKYSSAIASSERNPCNVGPHRSRNFGLQRNECKHCAYTNPHASWMWALKINMRRTDVRVSANWNFIIHQNFLNSCSHSRISELARPESANNGCPVKSWSPCNNLFFGNFLLTWWTGSRSDSRPTTGWPRSVTNIKLDTSTGEVSLLFDPLILESHYHLMLLSLVKKTGLKKM